MPSEYSIRMKAKNEFDKKRWLYWFFPRVKYRESDFFGFGDVAVLRKKEKDNSECELAVIQLTTYSNMSARIRKIEEKLNFIIKNGLYFPLKVEVWGYKTKDRKFRIFEF